jgi:hypothetical protein
MCKNYGEPRPGATSHPNHPGGPPGRDELLSDLRAWLKQNWDPDLTVGDWWERLGTAGWSAPGLPTNAYGRDIARADAVLVANEIATFGALGAPAGLGLLLAAPTIATHGTQEQIDLYVRDIVTGQKAWCQLFSEPQAGSDLAGLQTKASRTATSGSSTARRCGPRAASTPIWACCWPERTPTCPSIKASPTSPSRCSRTGVDVRPLKEMTGHALFNEVFSPTPGWPTPLSSAASTTGGRPPTRPS